MAEQKLPWKVIIKWFPLIRLNSTVYSKPVTVAGLTWGLPLPVANSPVKQISESMRVWCSAHPLHGSFGSSVSAQSCLLSCPAAYTSILLESNPVVADNLHIFGSLYLTWVASPCWELCIFMLSIQHDRVCRSRVFHLFFPGEDVHLIHSAHGKNFILQWVTTSPVWNLESVLEIIKTV